ncbi:MAG: HEPN domain-containing protein [Armatimonadetes bacterium]|nr:HEPN domain-containing protein [Armatimonadota bacterium]
MPREVQSPAEWMRYARSDLALAKAAASDEVMFESLCFHVQQAVEKSLKAVLISRGIPFPRTHNIDSLIGLLPDDVSVPPEDIAVAELTEYAATVRYPGMDEPVGEDEYHEAVRLAESVVKCAEEILGL